MEDVILHCPMCGQALIVHIEIKDVTVYSSAALIVSFKNQNVTHTCGSKPTVLTKD